MRAQQLETLAGRYRLVEVVGRGGMSTVYRAIDAKLRRTVAVKILSPALAEGDPVSLERFEREARAAASLNHRSVVAVYDTSLDEGTPFIVMEYVPGRSLAEILRDEGHLKPDRAAYIGEQVADALGAAHAAGIIHRDIKPGNVMVADDGSVKVLDFGIARALDATALTQTSMVPGTAAYMSPEQAQGETADERSDIYSLGCLVYAMLTGRPPFTGESSAAVLHQHMNAEVPGPNSNNPDVWPALDSLVLEMLEKSPDARPQSALEVRDRLAEALTGAPTALAETAATARLGDTAATRVASRPGAVAAPAPARGVVPVIAALLAVAALIAAILAISSSGSSTNVPPAGSGHSATSSTHSSRAPTTSAPTPSTPTHSTPSTSAPKPKPKAPASTPTAPGHGGTPPGHGGTPPGQAKQPGAGGTGP